MGRDSKGGEGSLFGGWNQQLHLDVVHKIPRWILICTPTFPTFESEIGFHRVSSDGGGKKGIQNDQVETDSVIDK